MRNTIPEPGNALLIYTVRGGDTLSGIAARFGIGASNWYKLLVNGRTYGERGASSAIFPGDVVAVVPTDQDVFVIAHRNSWAAVSHERRLLPDRRGRSNSRNSAHWVANALRSRDPRGEGWIGSLDNGGRRGVVKP